MKQIKGSHVTHKTHNGTTRIKKTTTTKTQRITFELSPHHYYFIDLKQDNYELSFQPSLHVLLEDFQLIFCLQVSFFKSMTRDQKFTGMMKGQND